MRPTLVGMGWFPDELGGVNRYLRGLLAALEEAGAAPRAVVLGPARDTPAGVTVAARSDAPLPLRLLAMHRATRTAELLDIHFALYGLLPTLRGRTPVVVHFQGPWAAESAGPENRPRRIRHAIEQAVYRRARVLVVLSEAFREVLVEDYGVARERIHVVPPGVELDRFTPGDRGDARDRLGVPPGAFVAVTARRLVSRMGLDVLLEAWRSVAEERDDALLLVAGEGAERDVLEARAAGLPVRFLGRVDDATLVDAYRAADVSVVPSVALEGFGLVALESLACGTPVVVTDVGGLPGAVRELDPSLVVPAGDAAALAARILAPLPNAAACRTHAERFGWKAVAQRHLELYAAAASPRLRVVYLDHTAVLSGAEIALARLVPALDVEAHAILAQDGPLAERLRAAGVTVEVLPLAEGARGLPRGSVGLGALPGFARSVAYSIRLARRLRALRPDVVHTNSLKSALYGGVAARLARAPCVWQIHDRIAVDYLPAAAVRLVRVAARVLPQAVIANSHSTLATLPPLRRSVVIPPPVPAASTRHDERPPGLRVGIVGRIAPWKGQHVFLAAFARAFPNGDVQGVVVGAPMFGANEDAYAGELRTQVQNLGLGDRVSFTGFRADIAAELARLDVLVHASVVPEPFGQVVVEGMAAGVAVIASDAGGPAEIIERERSGLLVPPGDVAALAAALQRLAGDSTLRARLAAAGLERARAYEPAAVAPQVLAVYRSVT